MSGNAILYRMEIDRHICPFGLRAKDLLVRKGFIVDDRILKTREEVENLKTSLGVKTTPQVFINNERIGGFNDLESYFNKFKAKESKVSYFPVLALFSVAALAAIGLSYKLFESFVLPHVAMQFIGLSMIMLGILKLQNVDGFVNGFLGYDLLARRAVPYAFVYPYAEILGGLLMLSNFLPLLSILIMLFIGGIGSVSVFKAVYIDKKELKCACVGGNSNVPLGFVSFTENAVMVSAAIWMLIVYLF